MEPRYLCAHRWRDRYDQAEGQPHHRHRLWRARQREGEAFVQDRRLFGRPHAAPARWQLAPRAEGGGVLPRSGNRQDHGQLEEPLYERDGEGGADRQRSVQLRHPRHQAAAAQLWRAQQGYPPARAVPAQLERRAGQHADPGDGDRPVLSRLASAQGLAARIGRRVQPRVRTFPVLRGQGRYREPQAHRDSRHRQLVADHPLAALDADGRGARVHQLFRLVRHHDQRHQGPARRSGRGRAQDRSGLSDRTDAGLRAVAVQP